MPHFSDMRKLIIFLFFIMTITSNLFGQNQSLTIYFDTLIPHSSTPFFILVSRPIYDKEFGNYFHSDTVIQATNLSRIETGLKFHIDIPNYNDSVELHIPFDNDNGFLKILNLKDTKNGSIRFDKWTVYANCLSDTVFNKTEYYRRNPEDSLPIPFKVTEKSQIINKICKTQTPKFKTTFKLNDQLYLVSIQIKQTSQIVRHGHSYNKDISKPYNKDKKLIFKHVIKEHRKYSNIITIRLKNEAYLVVRRRKD